MKEQMNYYEHYKKFMRMGLAQSIVKTSEYSSFSKKYPYITESIRLKREITRLTNKLKSEKVRSSRFRIKRELNVNKTKLRKNNLFKRLHGENKQESVFERKLKSATTKMRVKVLTKKSYTTLRQASRKLRGKLRRSMHRNLPPSVFNLRELDVAEKGLALREWIQERQKQRL